MPEWGSGPADKKDSGPDVGIRILVLVQFATSHTFHHRHGQRCPSHRQGQCKTIQVSIHPLWQSFLSSRTSGVYAGWRSDISFRTYPSIVRLDIYEHTRAKNHLRAHILLARSAFLDQTNSPVIHVYTTMTTPSLPKSPLE